MCHMISYTEHVKKYAHDSHDSHDFDDHSIKADGSGCDQGSDSI